MQLVKNRSYELDVLDINHLGYGVAKPDGFAVFVDGGVSGDRVLAKIIKVNASYAVAKTEKVLVPSPYRTEDRCSCRDCNACVYRQIDYAYEKKSKEENVRMAFCKAGLAEVRVAPLLSTDNVKEYRNKAQYPVSVEKDGKYTVGFFAPKSHRVREAAHCPLQPAVFADVLESIRAFLTKNRIPVYEEGTGKGWLRHIYLRRGEVSGEILLTLVVTDKTFPEKEAFVSQITAAFPSVVGILLNLQKDDTNVILGEEFVTLWGKAYLCDVLAGVHLRLSPASFYQVNHEAAELLYAKAAELASPTGAELLLDLYCGAGSIGLSMAHKVKEVIGIEIVESAVACAKQNAKDSGIENASFYAGDAADAPSLLSGAERARGEKIRPDVVVLDPPRKGCDASLLRFLGEELSPSRIVYISCNPETLARDAAILLPLGYVPGEVTPVDLFPGTGHVECVVLLSREKK